jgi:hypothetical protein
MSDYGENIKKKYDMVYEELVHLRIEKKAADIRIKKLFEENV